VATPPGGRDRGLSAVNDPRECPHERFFPTVSGAVFKCAGCGTEFDLERRLRREREQFADSVRCKIVCESVEPIPGEPDSPGRVVTMRVVTQIHDPAALAKLKPGRAYHMDLSPADES